MLGRLQNNLQYNSSIIAILITASDNNASHLYSEIPGSNMWQSTDYSNSYFFVNFFSSVSWQILVQFFNQATTFSASFPIHYSLTTLLADVIQSKVLISSLNAPAITAHLTKMLNSKLHWKNVSAGINRKLYTSTKICVASV